MNTTLVQYGIQTEQSDLRVHVSVVARRAYVYRTAHARNVIAVLGKDRARDVYTGNIKTAQGFMVKPSEIPGCRGIPIPDDLMERWPINPNDNTSTKGRMAVGIVKEMIGRGLIRINLDSSEVEDKDMQIAGLDIIVTGRAKVQVKCDYKAGEREYGGTGNLFLQTHEANPYGQH